jgi:alcohol dehydrogenase (cytochrome c)
MSVMKSRAILLLSASAAGLLLFAQTPSDVSFKRLLAADKEPQNWLTYSGTMMSQRYSQLTQITTENVRNLEPAWTLQTKTGEKFEATPLVVDGVMYTVVPPPPRGGRGGAPGAGRGRGGRGGAPGAAPDAAEAGLAAAGAAPAAPAPPPAPVAPAAPATPPAPQTFDVMALNAATGATLWSYSYLPAADAKPCCGRVNRGLAILGSTLYMGTTDAHLIALDAKSGKLLWNTEVAVAKEGYAITHAPLIVKDKVIIGTAGGEYGIRGFVAAYDAATGKEVWRFHNIPEPGEPGNNTWAGDSWQHGAASVWTTGSYDPELNLTYWGTGNAGPDFDGDAREGDNLYCNSVVALDADTGAIKWHYQFSPHDERDWDAAQIPLLADIQWQGQPRKVMMWANRNGVFYVLDRASGKFLLGKAFTTINWLGGFDENGRPKWAEGKLPKAGGEQVLLYPGVEGGTSWYSPSFSPRTGMFYVSAWDNYHQNVRKPEKPQPFVEGGVFGGGGGGGSNIGWNGGNVTTRKEEDGFGAVRAIDPATGEKKWEYKFTDITMAGILTTASDVLFSGAHNANFFALNARTGAELWKTTLAGAVYSGAMTYSVGGRQFVEVAGGNTMYVFALKP